MLCFSFSIRQTVATCDTSHQQQGPDRSHQWEVHTGGSSEEVSARAESQMWGVESCPVRAGPHHRRVALQICRVSDSSVAPKRVWFEITLNSTVCLMEIRNRWGMSFIHVSAGRIPTKQSWWNCSKNDKKQLNLCSDVFTFCWHHWKQNLHLHWTSLPEVFYKRICSQLVLNRFPSKHTFYFLPQSQNFLVWQGAI